MGRIYVTRHVEFEAAHVLLGYKGRCGSVHGHSYKLEVTISAPKRVRYDHDFGFVMDFKELDRILDEYIPDHCFITNTQNGEDTAEGQIVKILESNNMRIFYMNDSPSAENMCEKFSYDIQKILNDLNSYPEYSDYKVEEIKLWETTDSHATWKRGTNEDS